MSLIPQLRYLLSTAPFPLTASANAGDPASFDLILVITNPNPGVSVALSFIAIEIPVGSAAADLTTDTNLFTRPPSYWTTKTGTTSDAWQATFTAPAGTTVGSDSLTFLIQEVPINTQPGTVQITCIEGSQGCSGSGCPRVPLRLVKFPHGWGQVEFSVDDADLPAPANPTLSWNGPDGATYTIEYYTPQTGIVNLPAAGEPPLASSGIYPAAGKPGLGLTQTTAFTLNVSATIDGTPYTAQQQLTVTVSEATLSANDSNVSCPGNPTLSWHGGATDGSYTLKWNDQSAKLAGGGSGSYPTTNDPKLNLQETTTFTLEVSRDGYSYTKQVTVTVNPNPLVVSFTAKPLPPEMDPSTGTLASTVELSWSLQCAGSFEITEQSGNGEPIKLGVPTNVNSYHVYPRTKTTNYSITAISGSTISETKTVTVTTYVPSPTVTGYVSSDGTIKQGTKNFSVKCLSGGDFSITFSPPLSSTPIVTAQSICQSWHAGWYATALVKSVSASSLEIMIVEADTKTPYAGADFTFSAMVP